MNGNYDKLSLHFKYCGFIAVMFIIAIATERWSSNKDFTIYLSNAATMTSLLLGVVAIFYSFVSNDGMSRSLGSITTVSNEVRDARHEIEGFVQLTKEATEANSGSTALVRDASQNISSSLVSLDGTLRTLSTQNETLKSLLASLPTRLDQLESRFGDVAKALGEKPQPAQVPQTPTDIPARPIGRFLARASLYQNLLTLACVLAGTSKKNLSVAEFCKAVELNSPSNFNGFLSCMSAIQLCYQRAIEGEDKTYAISNVHPELTARTRSYFTEYLDTEFASKPDEKSNWLKKLASVEALFVS